MGLRFRKSIKVAHGIKVNLNKKSLGLTLGGKGIHHTVNSSGRRTSSVGIPGTGLSYVSSSGGGSGKARSNKSASVHGTDASLSKHSSEKWYKKTGWIFALLIFFFPVGLFLMWKYTNWSTVAKSIISAVIGILAIIGLQNPSPTLESITISSITQGQLEVNQDYIINIDGNPASVKLSDAQYVSDNTNVATFEQKDEAQATLHTITPGTVTIHVKKSDIESNALTLNIIDSSIAQEPAEQEAVITETTDQPIQEEVPVSEQPTEMVKAIDVVNIRSQDNTDSDILGKSAVGDIFTRYETMDNGWSRIDYNGNEAYMKSEYLETYTGDFTTEKAAEAQMPANENTEPAQQEAADMPEPQQAGVAYVTNTGKKYHLDPTCGNMNSAIEIPLENAMKNYEPCNKCAQ